MRHVRTGLWQFAIVLSGWCAFSGCTEKPTAAQPWAGWVKEQVRYAHYFQLWSKGQARMLLTFGPGGESDTTGIFLVGADAGVAVLPSGAVRLQAPLRRVALMSTTHASFISALGKARAVVGCAYTARLRDTAVAALAQAGKVQEIGAADGVDRERVLKLAPDALFTYPYGSQGQGHVLGHVPVVQVAEYLEEHPLGRAEWLRAFGLLFGVETKADSLFKGIVARYDSALAVVPADKQGPVVFFGSAWKGTWSVPSGGSYMARLIKDAGGSYLFMDRQAKGNIDLDLETVLEKGASATRWGRILDQAAPVTPKDVAGGDARILALPVFKQGGCFYASSAESDLFGKAGLEPDVVLRDLIGIFQPELSGGRVPVYFKPVQ